MKNIILLITILLTCLTQNFAQIKAAIIEGTVINSNSKSVILFDVSQNKIADSCKLENGKFKVTVKTLQPNYFQLVFTETEMMYIVAEPGVNINVTYDGKIPDSPKVTGSPASELIYNTVEGMKKYDIMAAEYTNKMAKEKRNFIRTTITNNPKSLANIFLLSQLSTDNDIDMFKLVDKELFPLYPDNTFVSEMHQKLLTSQHLLIGSVAPDFEQTDVSGNKTKLSAFRNYYLLIDFWASWCKPCRAENPYNVELYHKYKGKGFQILGVSLDEDKKAWLLAITQDRLPWVHVSDLKGWANDVAKLYDIQQVPFTYLLDKNGVIIAKGLRGEALAEKLKEIFGE